jgi:VCBS repeat-containing protein
MQQQDRPGYTPKGPTTGPMRPLIVVMETTGEDTQGDPRPTAEEEMQSPQQQDAEQDRLPPITEEEEESGTPPAPPQPDESDAPEPTPPPREPRPLSLPVVAARTPRSFPLLVAGTLGISIILLGVALGILLATNPTSLGPMIAWLPGITPTASVTLTPAQESLHTSVPITAVTGTPDPTREQVSARLLSVKSRTFTQAVPVTGHGHTQAQQAQGTLTFYNAAPYAQTVAAGTVLTGADGVALVTDQAAYLPAGNLPAVGIATVPAQAVQVGPQGNIAPLDLNGLCCVAGVSVKNMDAFWGGQNARDYTVVAWQDVEAVAGPQSSTLTQAAQAGLQGEIRPNEQLASPAQCHPALHTDHPIGSEATHVTITLSVTCQGEVYDAQAVQQLANAALSEQARKSLGAGYSVQGTIKTTVTQVATTEAAHGTLSLLVNAQGTWSYQFSSAQINQLSRRIAGLPRQQAIHLLKQEGHIQAVNITETWNATNIPTDPAHIQMMVLDVVNG